VHYLRLKRILYILAFLPTITFNLPFGETAPWASLISIIVLYYIWREVFLILVILLPSFLIGIFSDVGIVENIHSFASYYNGIILFFIILRRYRMDCPEIIWALKFILIMTISIGVMQDFLADSKLFNHALSFFLSRFSNNIELSGNAIGYKGVSGLSTEPGRQAIDLMLIYATLISVNAFSKRNMLYLDLLILSYIVFFNKSITGLLFLSVYFIIRFVTINKRGGLSMLFFALFAISLLYIFQNESHMFITLRELLGADSMEEIFYKLRSISGHRFATTISAYSQISLFGVGIGNWHEGVLKGLDSYPEFYNGISYFKNQDISSLSFTKPTSFFATLFLESGFLSGLMIILLLTRSVHRVISRKIAYFDTPLFVLPVFSLLILGYVGSPVALGCLAVILLNKDLNMNFGITPINKELSS
jgi:hypothetical protein